jgi:hypothetical protein
VVHLTPAPTNLEVSASLLVCHNIQIRRLVQGHAAVPSVAQRGHGSAPTSHHQVRLPLAAALQLFVYVHPQKKHRHSSTTAYTCVAVVFQVPLLPAMSPDRWGYSIASRHTQRSNANCPCLHTHAPCRFFKAAKISPDLKAELAWLRQRAEATSRTTASASISMGAAPAAPSHAGVRSVACYASLVLPMARAITLPYRNWCIRVIVAAALPSTLHMCTHVGIAPAPQCMHPLTFCCMTLLNCVHTGCVGAAPPSNSQPAAMHRPSSGIHAPSLYRRPAPVMPTPTSPAAKKPRT